MQLDPSTREFVGLAIIDYRQHWEGKPIKVEVPHVEHRVLEMV